MSVFANQALALADLRAGQLTLAAASFPQVAGLPDDYLWQKLLEAEQEVGRRLGIPLEPTEIFIDPPTAAELAELSGAPYRVEPGYDLEQGFFSPDRWGQLRLRYRPIISVSSIQLIYPLFGLNPIDIPLDWLRIDHQYGAINLFPYNVSSLSTQTLFLTTLYSGGSFPTAIRLRYRAGLDNVEANYPDVLGIIRRMAVLRLLHDAFLPQSGSITSDGLSQSTSINLAVMQDSLDKQLDTLKLQLTGLVFAVA